MNPLLSVRDLKVSYKVGRMSIDAVDGASFDVPKSSIVGLVGESGCGKTTVARALTRVMADNASISGGQMLFEGRDLAALPERDMNALRWRDIAFIPQSAMNSLDPVYTIGAQIVEGIRYHKPVNNEEARAMAREMLARVNMPDPQRILDSYPHQLSGGMRQRAMIAIALACGPSLLIADEPTTALDVTTEAQILELLSDLQEQFGMAILYITHNLGVVAEMVEEAIVMYLGKVVERGSVEALFQDPKHPYLQALMRSVPRLGQKSNTRLEAISGMVPSPFAVPSGCAFHPRCPQAIAGLCNVKEPPVIEFEEGHWARCFLYA